MNVARSDDALRPLSLGEVLDRAVNLCVRRFVPLSLIFLAYAVPVAVVQFYAGEDFARIMHGIAQSLAAGSGKAPDPQALARTLAAVHTNGWYTLLVALTFFVAPLPTAALISAVSEAYLGRAMSFVRAYRSALGRWLPLVGINVLYALALGALNVAFVLVLVVVITGIAFLTVSARPVGIALALLFGFCGLAAITGFFVVAALAFQVSYFTCVVERANVRQAFSLGISRVFGGVGLRRSLVVGIVFLTLALGIAIVSSLGEALLAGLLHNAVAGMAYATIVRIATAAFTTAFIGIFYFDLRVREEGLDLQLAAQNALGAELPPA